MVKRPDSTERPWLALCSALCKPSRNLQVEPPLRLVSSTKYSALLCLSRPGAAEISDAALHILQKARATEMLYITQAHGGRNSNIPPELCFLPSKPTLWPCQSSKFEGKSSQSEKKKFSNLKIFTGVDFVNYLSLQTMTGAFSSYTHLTVTMEH